MRGLRTILCVVTAGCCMPVLAGSAPVKVDDLEDGSSRWSVEGEQHSTLSLIEEGFAGTRSLRIDIVRAKKGWSNIKLDCECPENAEALRFKAKALDAPLSIHPQFKISRDWENWGLWLNPQLDLVPDEWRTFEVQLDEARALFVKGSVELDLLVQKTGINEFLISANQDAAAGSFLIDDVEWVLSE